MRMRSMTHVLRHLPLGIYCVEQVMRDSMNQSACTHCLPDCNLFTYTYTIQSKPLTSEKFCTIEDDIDGVNHQFKTRE